MLAYAVSVKDEYRTDKLLKNLEDKFNSTAKINFPPHISDFIIQKIPNNLKMNVILEEIKTAIQDEVKLSNWNYKSSEIILPTGAYNKNITEEELIGITNIVAEVSINTAIDVVAASCVSAAYRHFNYSGDVTIREALGEKMYEIVVGRIPSQKVS